MGRYYGVHQSEAAFQYKVEGLGCYLGEVRCCHR